MKKVINGLRALIYPAAVVWGAWFCMVHASDARESVADALDRCLYVLIPSLYPMLIVSGIIIGSGLLDSISRFAEFPARLLLGMDGKTAVIFIFSMFAGYPVGTKMIFSGYSAGNISKRRAELLAGLCFGAGPAFISGCIAHRLYGSDIPGRIVLISAVSADLLLAALLSAFSSHKPGSPVRGKMRKNTGMLTGSIRSAGKSMADICFTVIAFSVLVAAADKAGITGYAARAISCMTGKPADISAKLLAAFLDVTAVSELPRGDYTLLPYICALTSFGGVCVFFQLAAITGGRLSMAVPLLMRTAASAASFWICRLIMPHMLSEETLPASSAVLHSAASPVPSLLLILMTVMVIREDNSLRERDINVV